MNKKKQGFLVFDESVGDDYKSAFEESGFWKVVLTTRQRRVTARKRFDDPEIFKMGEYKFPVITRDCVMTGDIHTPFKKAGKIILRQPDKNKGESKEEYKAKISRLMATKIKDPNFFNGKVSLIPVKKATLSIKWDAFIKKFPTKETIYAYEVGS